MTTTTESKQIVKRRHVTIEMPHDRKRLNRLNFWVGNPHRARSTSNGAAVNILHGVIFVVSLAIVVGVGLAITALLSIESDNSGDLSFTELLFVLAMLGVMALVSHGLNKITEDRVYGYVHDKREVFLNSLVSDFTKKLKEQGWDVHPLFVRQLIQRVPYGNYGSYDGYEYTLYVAGGDSDTFDIQASLTSAHDNEVRKQEVKTQADHAYDAWSESNVDFADMTPEEIFKAGFSWNRRP